MKTLKKKYQISEALASHVLNMKSRTEEQTKLVAAELGWTIEYLKGYCEGVKWAYEWILKDAE